MSEAICAAIITVIAIIIAQYYKRQENVCETIYYSAMAIVMTILTASYMIIDNLV